MSGLMKVYCEHCKKFPKKISMEITNGSIIIECSDCGAMQRFRPETLNTGSGKQ